MSMITPTDSAICFDNDKIRPSVCSAMPSLLVPDWSTTMTPAAVQGLASIMSQPVLVELVADMDRSLLS